MKNVLLLLLLTTTTIASANDSRCESEFDQANYWFETAVENFNNGVADYDVAKEEASKAEPSEFIICKFLRRSSSDFSSSYDNFHRAVQGYNKAMPHCGEVNRELLEENIDLARDNRKIADDRNYSSLRIIEEVCQ